jgi:flagellar assembly protein FliH
LSRQILFDRPIAGARIRMHGEAVAGATAGAGTVRLDEPSVPEPPEIAPVEDALDGATIPPADPEPGRDGRPEPGPAVEEAGDGPAAGSCECAEVLRSVMENLRDETTRLHEESESAVIHLVVAIVRKIVGGLAERRSGLIEETARSCVRKVEGERRVTLRLNRDDLEAIGAIREELVAENDELKAIDLVPDDRIERGGVVLEGRHVKVDARVETRIAAVVDELLKGLDDE